jgi:hypothetical protein
MIMSAPGPKSEKEQNLAQVELLVEERVKRARKEEILDIYEELLTTIWNRILPTLGQVTVVAIVERALVITARKYPQIRYLRVLNHGIDFNELRQHADESEIDLLREALKDVLTKLIDILAALTGDVLVRQLIKEFEGDRGNER